MRRKLGIRIDKFGSAFMVLMLSRVFGLFRELVISAAFGFSKITDAFYQSSFALVALQSIANGPFTTAFSARFAGTPYNQRLAHLRYYKNRAVWIGLGLSVALVIASVVCALVWQAGVYLSLSLAILAPAALFTVVTGYVFAVATAIGRVATAALVLFIANAVFVLGIIGVWISRQPLAYWTLPTLFTIAAFAGAAFSLKVYRNISSELADDKQVTTTPKAIEGLGLAFVLASVETGAFLLTQLVILILAGLAGTGWASAISVVQRIVFSINGLLVSPVASLLMLRVVEGGPDIQWQFKRTVLTVGVGLVFFGGLLSAAAPMLIYWLIPETSSKYSSAEQVATLLPSFALWLVPLGLNIVVCRVMFGLKLDGVYTVSTVIAYGLANIARVALAYLAGLNEAIIVGALVELVCVLYLSFLTSRHLLDQARSDEMINSEYVLFTMAFHSGMGRFACELVNGARRFAGDAVALVAPEMEYEPTGVRRIRFRRPIARGPRWRKLFSLVRMNMEAFRAVWRSCRAGSVFIMVDLFSTVPLSIVPAWIARLRGARTVLNLHDFYPHALRYPKHLQGLERWLYRLAYRQFDVLAVMKLEQVERLVREAGVPLKKIVVITHGAFPIEGVRHADVDSELERILILGSLRANKMVRESIEAVKTLQTRRPRIALRIAGAPRREELEYWELCRQDLFGIKQLELIDRYIPDEELANVISEVDVLLCPYSDFDSQSGVSIVGISNAIPLVATSSAFVAGTEAAAEVGQPVTPESIADALELCLSRPRAMRQRHADEQRDRFLAQSQWTQAIERIVEALELNFSHSRRDRSSAGAENT